MLMSPSIRRPASSLGVFRSVSLIGRALANAARVPSELDETAEMLDSAMWVRTGAGISVPFFCRVIIGCRHPPVWSPQKCDGLNAIGVCLDRGLPGGSANRKTQFGPYHRH